MSPVGGQGINIALRDIVVLANHLVPVLRAGDDAEAVDTALEAYTRERSPEVETVQGFQRAAPKVLLSDGWRTAMLMQVLRILRFGPVRRFAARHGAAPLLEGTCVVRLRV
jgi:2-polyprenyl-6-methoxyphenol hydroxylase-like FAD-dependent oxidoreductase